MDHENPRLIVAAGPNGSGKTTITEQGLAHEWFEGCLYINPDIIAQEQFSGWNDPESAYDNSPDDLPPRLLARFSNGELAKRYPGEIPDWAKDFVSFSG